MYNIYEIYKPLSKSKSTKLYDKVVMIAWHYVVPLGLSKERATHSMPTSLVNMQAHVWLIVVFFKRERERERRSRCNYLKWLIFYCFSIVSKYSYVGFQL